MEEYQYDEVFSVEDEISGNEIIYQQALMPE